MSTDPVPVRTFREHPPTTPAVSGTTTAWARVGWKKGWLSVPWLVFKGDLRWDWTWEGENMLNIPSSVSASVTQLTKIGSCVFPELTRRSTFVCHTCRNFVKAEVKGFPSSVESCCMIMRRLLKLIKSINTLHANQFSSLHTKCRLLVWRNREGKTVYLLCFFCSVDPAK